MYWENPGYLLCWWIVPVLAGLFIYAHRKRLAAAKRFADLAMLVRLQPVVRPGRMWLKNTAVLVGIICLIAAAARPRWGVYFEEVQSRGVDVFVLLDVSRSMLAEDVAPNRLERAKSDIRDLLMRLEGDRVGLIAFAGAAVPKVPLTTDQGFFQLVLDEIDTSSAPRGGSLIGAAIMKALESMPEQPDRDQVIVLITDGEDHDSFPEEAADAASKRGVKIFTVGLGDSLEGRRIPIRDDSGQLSYLTHEGREVWSKMDESLLKSIALKTGGAYVPARTTTYDLGQIYDDHLVALTQGEISAETRKRYRDRFQLFLVMGLGFLLLDTLVPRYPRTNETGKDQS